MSKTERITSIKAKLTDIDEWLDKYRAARDAAPNYYKNQALAHELRKELMKLRDPQCYQMVYGGAR
jgi:hypothetical protein